MKHISINRWGKDHWSTFAYAEVLAVDGGKDGLIVPVKEKMRTNEKRHSYLAGCNGFGNVILGSEYPTRLKGNSKVDGHDDWDCLDDAVNEGLLEDVGSGLNRAFELTELGREIANQLRTHKSQGGVFSDFEVNEKLKESSEDGK